MGNQHAAERLARACDEVTDVQMRVMFIRHELGVLPKIDGADVLALAARSAELGDRRARVLFQTAVIALAPPVATDLREELAHAAYLRGHRDLARMLTREGSDDPDEAARTRVPDFGTGRPLTLGERKSLARRRDRQLLVRVLADPHPDVIRLLLQNPMLVEADVVRLAARRPIGADVQREIAGSARWMLRPSVRLTLVKNPHSPRDVTLPLLSLLVRNEVEEVASAPDLSVAVLETARRILGRPLFA